MIIAKNYIIQEEHLVRVLSSGILILYAGVERLIGNNVDYRGSSNKVIPVIGIHRPYFDKSYFKNLSPIDAENKYREMADKVRSYLDEMGAPADLFELMLKTPSNKIRYFTADKFRRYIEDTSPFLSEWLIARCGGDFKEALSNQEIKDFRRISVLQHRAMTTLSKKLGRSLELKEIMEVYPNNEFPMAYMKKLYEIVRDYNRKKERCRAKSVYNYQLEWAKMN